MQAQGNQGKLRPNYAITQKLGRELRKGDQYK